jgi:catechol 2,3-dioxygenase
MNGQEPILDIAHLGHVEMLTPKLEESLRFFVDVMGITESDRQGESIYLRGWDDYEHQTLKLTASKLPGLGHFAYRVRSPQALERRVAALESSGRGTGWTDGDLGHGPAYAFTSRGVNLRRLDHVNLLAVDVPAIRRFLQDYLGFRLTEQIVFDDGSEKGIWLTTNNKSYDVAVTEDFTGVPGRFHHVTYVVDSREEVLRAADICLEHGAFIETGPHKHAIQQTFFLYVYEPGGNRFEVANAGARLILAPDWKTIVWSQEERKKGQAWGLQTVESFHTHGTPPVD